VGADELELPAAMVAMAAVVVCLVHHYCAALTSCNTCQVQASLDEKVTGLDFNADTCEDSYNTFISFLVEIHTQKPPAYHWLMSDLY
jgi:hypothetical protein